MTTSDRSSEELREFLGLSGPSLLAAFGLIVGLLGSVLMLRHLAFLVLAGAGVHCIATALAWNARLDPNLRWRSTNMQLHRGMLAAVIIVAIFCLFAKSRGLMLPASLSIPSLPSPPTYARELPAPETSADEF